MKLINKKLNTVLIFSCIIIFDGINLIYKLLSSPSIINHLSIALSTDPVNGSLWADLMNIYSIGRTIHPVIGLAPEVLINNTLGFKYIWLSIIIFKAVCASFFYYSLATISQIKKDNLNNILLLVLIFMLFNSISLIYGDRISRPHLNPTIILVSLCVILSQSKNVIAIFIIGILQCIPIAHDPWIAQYSLIFIVFLLWVLEKNFFKIFIFLIGVLLAFIIAYYRIVHVAPVDVNYLEYLGKKEIYNRGLFYYDYLLALLKSPYIILPSLWIIVISIVTKQAKIAIIFTLTLFFAALPVTILGAVVQPYHYKIAASTFAIIISVIISIREPLFYYYIRGIKYKLNIFFIFVILITSFGLLTSDGFPPKNRLFERAAILDRDYKKLVEILKIHKNKNPDCLVVTNDIFFRPYVLIENISILPKEGILMTRPSSVNNINDELMDVAYSLAYRRKFLNDTISTYSDIEMAKDLFLIRVHDKYSSSRSWMAKSVRANSEYSDSEIHEINNIESLKAWPFRVPNELIVKTIKISNQLILSDINRIFIVIKISDNNIKMFSNCN